MAPDMRKYRLWSWRTGGAVVIAAVLLNAFTLLPATHNHDALHDGDACAICQLQATGALTPAPAPDLPAPHLLTRTSPAPDDTPSVQWTTPGTPTRGPPDCTKNPACV